MREHYLTIRRAYVEEKYGEPFTVTIAQLAIVLQCTERYVKHLLRTMEGEGYIHWQPGRGRGNHSQLTFLMTEEELRFKKAEELVLEGKFEEAMTEINPVEPTLQGRFQEWLKRQMGLKVEGEQDQQIDVLRYPFYYSIKTLDPLSILSRHEGHLVEQLYDTLLTFDVETQQLQPKIAHHWEYDEESRIWRFFLRKGIKFHNGDMLTAADVVATIKRALNPNHTIYKNLSIEGIVRVVSRGDYQVDIELREENQLLPYYFSVPRISIVPKNLCENQGPNDFHIPIGSGPFRITRHDDEMIILESFNDYYWGRPHLDRIEILNLPELYQEANDTLRYFVRDEEELSDWQEIKQMEEGAAYLLINRIKKGICEKKSFREAINLAINRESFILDLESSDWRIPATSFLTEISKREYKNESSTKLAKKLLQDVGYNGEPLRLFATQIRKNANLSREAMWIIDQLRKIGLTINAEVIPIEELAKPSVYIEADFLLDAILLGDNISFTLYNTYISDLSFIRSLVGEELRIWIEQQLAKVKKEKEQKQQLALLLEIENRLKEEHTLLFLFHRSHRAFINKSLNNALLTSNGRINYKQLWIR